jgi:hypothetical protein
MSWFRICLTALLSSFTLTYAVAGCFYTPFEPKPWVPLDPPPVYYQWWAEAVECAPAPMPFFERQPTVDDVEWREVLNAAQGFECNFDFQCAGLTVNRRIIYIGTPWVMTRQVVIHEALHVLTRESHVDGPSFVACGVETP